MLMFNLNYDLLLLLFKTKNEKKKSLLNKAISNHNMNSTVILTLLTINKKRPRKIF
jgi:hypothetical protein